MHRNLAYGAIIVATTFATGCSGTFSTSKAQPRSAAGSSAPVPVGPTAEPPTEPSSEEFQDMTASEHRAAAEHENRLADQEFEEARQTYPTPGSTYPGYEDTPFFSPFDRSMEPEQPEYYTGWPRIHDPGEEATDAGRKHRKQAEEHERAAARKDSEGRRVY